MLDRGGLARQMVLISFTVGFGGGDHKFDHIWEKELFMLKKFRFILPVAVLSIFLGLCMPSVLAYADIATELGDVPLLQDGDMQSATQVRSLKSSLAPKGSSSDPIMGVIEQAVKNWDGSSTVTITDLFAYQMDRQTLQPLLQAFLKDSPEYFYMTGAYSLSYNTETGYVTSVKLSANSSYTAEDVGAFNAKMSEIASMCDPSWTEERKVIFAHDYIATHCNYDLSYSRYNAFECLVNHSAVCQGYSLAFKAIANRIGLQCDVISSNTLNHAWNYVIVDGLGYYVDVTWDDPIVSSTVATYHDAFVCHTNFLRSRAGIISTGHNASGATFDTNTAVDWVNSSDQNIYNSYAVDSTKYDWYFWSATNSVIIDFGDKYIFRDGTSSKRLSAYDKSSGTISTWLEIPAMNSYYDSIAKLGTRIVIATPTSIYLTAPDGSAYSQVLSNEGMDCKFYGIVEDADGLYYELMDNPAGTVYDRVKLDVASDSRPSSIVVSAPSEVSLDAHEIDLSATVYPYDAQYSSLTWTSSNPEVACFEDSTVGKLSLVSAGTVTVSVSCSDYPDVVTSADITVTSLKPLSDDTCLVEGIESSYPYTRSPIEPQPTVTYNGVELIEGTDYVVSYENNLNAGMAQCIISGIGSYYGSITKSFSISRVQTYSLSAVSNGLGSPVYDGTPKQELYFILSHNGTKLVEGVDFTAAYDQNISAGKGKIYFKGMGNYYGTAGLTFTISTLSLASSSITYQFDESSLIYDGTAKEPTVSKMIYKGLEIPLDNLSVAYSDNVNAGTMKATITPATDNVSSSKTISLTISPRDIAEARAMATSQMDSTGNPVLAVSFNGIDLAEGTDYTVSWNGTEATLSGMGNFNGQKVVSVDEIVKLEQSPIYPQEISLSYKSTYEPIIENVADGAVVSMQISDTNIASLENGVVIGRDVGATSLIVDIAETALYKAKSLAIPVTVAPRDISGVNISGIENAVWAGVPVTLSEITVLDGEDLLVENSDYTVKYSNNDKPGSASVTIEGKGRYCGTISSSFEIDKELRTVDQPADIQVPYKGSAQVVLGEMDEDPALSYVVDDTSVADVSADGIVTGKKAGSATLTVNIAETATYKAAQIEIPITVSPLTINTATISEIAAQEYTGLAIEPNVVLTLGGSVLVAETDYTVEFSDNVEAGTARFVVSGINNYTGSISGTFQITAPEPPAHQHSYSIVITWNGTKANYEATCACGDTITEPCSVTSSITSKASFSAAGNIKYIASATVDGITQTSTKNEPIDRVIEPTIATQNWTGKALTPAITLKDESGNVIPTSNYKVAYANNTAVGTGKATITLQGSKYSGTTTKTFAITHKQHAHTSVAFAWSGTSSAKYKATCACGHAVSGTATITKSVTAKATTTKNGNIRYTATAKVDGKTYTSTKNVSIPKISTVTLSYTSKAYTGKALTPTVKVKLSSGAFLAASSYTVTYKNNKSVGSASVVVKFKGNYSGSVTKTFKILPPKTSLKSLTAQSKGFTVNWTKQATQTTGYQIMYSTSSSFASNNKTVTISKNSTVTHKVTKLIAKKKYYVKIRTYKTVGSTKYYSTWSAVKNITTK